MSDLTRFSTLLYQVMGRLDHLQKSVDSLRRPAAVDKEYLNLEQAASFICRSKKTVYGLVNSGSIPHSKTGKRLVFNRQELKDWIEASRRKTVQEELASAEQEMISRKTPRLTK